MDAALNRISMTAFVIDNEDSIQSVYENLARRAQMAEAAKSAGMDLYSCVECFMESEDKQTTSTHWGPEGERLCAKHAAAKPGSEEMTPGIAMSPVDLIRNFILNHFSTEEEMRRVHAEHWSPIEQKHGVSGQQLEQAFVNFLESRSKACEGKGLGVQSRWG